MPESTPTQLLKTALRDSQALIERANSDIAERRETIATSQQRIAELEAAIAKLEEAQS